MSPPTTERRRSRRRKPTQLVYLEFGKENGGMVKDVSEGGMRFFLINPVNVGQSLRFTVNIDAARRLEGQAVMVWTDAGRKSGGMSFSEMSAESRENLRSWLAEIDSLSSDPVATVPIAPTPATTPLVAPPPVATLTLAPAPVLPISAASAPVVAAHVSPASTAPAPVPARPHAEIPAEVSAPASSKVPPEIPMASHEASHPVTREDWIRAARENLVPDGRSSNPIATGMTARGAATSIEEKPRLVLPPNHLEIRPAETKKFEKLAERVDPLREFLRQPLDDSAFAHSHVQADGTTLQLPPKRMWSTSRVVMVLALAAICGAAAAFAAIAYRQTVGESIIELGEKISGQPRSHASGDGDQRPAEPSLAMDPQADSAKSQAKQPAASGDNNGAPSPVPPASRPTKKPATPPRTSPITQTHPRILQQSQNPQTELAAGREFVPGKPKHLPQDLASLWNAVENGDTSAEVQLANRYIKGDGIGKNCDQARVLLQAAAKRGNELAAKRLTELSNSGCQ
jgi:hypothetical protein